MEPSDTEEPQPDLSSLHGRIAEVIWEARRLNSINAPTRCRSLSLVLTNLEQAMHWAEDAYRVKVAEASRRESADDDE
jgi:hypothetical protein